MALLIPTTGLLLPWLSGALLLMSMEARVAPDFRPNRLRQTGYGFFLGYAILFIAVVASNAWFGQVSWPWIMAFLALVAVAAAVVLYVGPARPAAIPEAENFLTPAAKTLLLVLAAWTGLHLLIAVIEVIHQPLYPWDAWTTWVYRAKVWFLAGGMVDMVRPSVWAAATSADVYTINAWDYPRFASFIPYWSALSLGSWSETLINLPVLLGGIAMGLALIGQCRESGMGMLASIAAGYLLFSVPLYATHIAQAGYADFWMAGFTGLGFIALVRGTAPGLGFQTALGLALLAFAIAVKNEGTVWFLSALLWLLLVYLPWRVTALSAVVIGVMLAVAWSLGVTHVDIPVAGRLGVVDGRLYIPMVGAFVLEVHSVWRAYWANFFTMGSWNLLWVLVVASLAVALGARQPLKNPTQRSGAIFIFILLTTQWFIFGCTYLGIWANTYTAINRLPMHFLPALIFAALIIIHARLAKTSGIRHAANADAQEATVDLPRFLTTALVAVLLVTAGSIGFLAQNLPPNPVDARHYAATDFNFVMGSGSERGDQLVVDEFSDGYALLSTGPVNIQSANYRFLRLTLDSSSNESIPTLFWRRADAPAELIRTAIRESGDILIDLSAKDHWRGEVSELGFLLEENGGAVVVGPITLEPDRLVSRLRLAWNNWSAFESKSQKSVNFLQGGRAEQPLRLPALLIAWLILTVVLNWLLFRRSGGGSRPLWVGAAMALLAAWMLLDIRWTVNSLRQAGQTLEKYSGVSEPERLARGLDGIVYSYVARLKADVLPAAPARILLVGDQRAVEYYLRRAKYHLLPHSVYATRRFPAKPELSSLDYVIFLGPAEAIGRTRGWNAQWETQLGLADSGDMGVVYQVLEMGLPDLPPEIDANLKLD